MESSINKIQFSVSQIKCLMQQLLAGVQYLHEQEVMHRDIKGANLLLSKHGILKLTDFGLARKISPSKKNYTNRVVTLWYRAPELLLGSDQYDTSIDIWSVG
jgi:serine/threonine protein kinase